MERSLTASTIDRVAFMGNYLPRQCGIATFTTDLCEAMATEYSGTTALPCPSTILKRATPIRRACALN